MAEVGDSWRILILRDALNGLRRFDEFQANLGIASNILAQRLGALVDDGLLERQQYQDRPARYEYIPTAKARDLWPLFVVLIRWGTKWLSPEGPTVQLIDRVSGQPVDYMIVERSTGEPLRPKNLAVRPVR
ncbi:MAG TPA: helix-turn-helix domain-containing protein [Gemmatimonadaceae bacterium]|nr:helix-turn-helix domain-containing protein [Gemmatimonadaceae bacterium]